MHLFAPNIDVSSVKCKQKRIFSYHYDTVQEFSILFTGYHATYERQNEHGKLTIYNKMEQKTAKQLKNEAEMHIF